MNCIIDVNGSFCGNPAELNHESLWLCPEHSLARQMNRKRAVAKASIKAVKPTGVYFIRTPYNTIKIGATRNLYRRLTELHCDFNLRPSQRLELLAWDPDCFYYNESIYQYRYWDLLLMDREGEQFEPDPAILDEANVIGIHDNTDYNRYLTQYRPSGDAKHKAMYLPAELRGVA